MALAGAECGASRGGGCTTGGRPGKDGPWDGRQERWAILIDGADRNGVSRALGHANPGREAAGRGISAVWGDTSPRAGVRVSQRQEAGIHVSAVPAVRASQGAYTLPHTPAESAVERVGRNLLRQLQTL